ncbi:unnamed protein product, partial [Sphagnum balticum]
CMGGRRDENISRDDTLDALREFLPDVETETAGGAGAVHSGAFRGPYYEPPDDAGCGEAIIVGDWEYDAGEDIGCEGEEVAVNEGEAVGSGAEGEGGG